MSALALVQGLYYLLSGVWALVHIDSFQQVTGKKTDLWLVKTVGLLLVGIGAGLILAAYRGQFAPEVLVIAVASAAALLTIDLVYVLKRVISPVYAADAVVEAGFIIGWGASLSLSA